MGLSRHTEEGAVLYFASSLDRGKPAHRNPLVNATDYDIVATYGAEYRGIVQYYLPAVNVRAFNRLRWVMLTSLLKTLAMKHRSTVTKMANKYQATTVTPSGPRVCFEAIVQREGRKPLVARFGGIPLKRQKAAVLHDRIPGRASHPQRELVTRLLNGRCELCAHAGEVQAHHVRRLADLSPSGPTQPAWMRIMAKRRRKTLVVCAACHDHIHPGHRATD